MKIGDIVSCGKKWLPVTERAGEMYGVVLADNGDSVGVEFYGLTSGHNCAGMAKDRKGWFCQRNNLAVIEAFIDDEEEEFDIGF